MDRLLMVCALALLLAACGGADGGSTTLAEVSATTPSQTTTLLPSTTSPSTAPTTTTSPPTTIVPTSSTATSTTSPSITGASVVFGVDGLGVVRFGDDAEVALATLIEELGRPSYDTGWSDPTAPPADVFLGCPGSRARVVSWEGVLGVVFTDWDGSVDDRTASTGRSVLAGAGLWRDSPVPTVDGAHSLDTLGTLRQLFGGRLFESEAPDEAVGLYWFAVDGTENPLSRSGGLRGWLFWPGYPDGPDESSGPPDSDWVAAGFTAGVSCETP